MKMIHEVSPEEIPTSILEKMGSLPAPGGRIVSPGGISCVVKRCPGCSASLKICKQALSPSALTEEGVCPVCGIVVARWVVSIEETEEPITRPTRWKLLAILVVVLVVVMLVSGGKS